MPARRLCLLILLIPWLVACPRQETRETAGGEDVLEVEDVSLPVDTGLSTEADAKGPKIIEGVAGILPSDYPRSLPTPETSSVNDFGSTPGGGRFVEFDSPTTAPTVAASLEKHLRQSGWQLRVVGEGRLEASRDGVQVSIAISDLYSGSRIRVEYR